jgi:hypothetical protein
MRRIHLSDLILMISGKREERREKGKWEEEREKRKG